MLFSLTLKIHARR